MSAYATAQQDMSAIKDRSGLLPAMIREAVQVVVQGEPREVQMFLPDQIRGALSSVEVCV